MSFDIDPADERTQLDECIHEIKILQARIAVLEKVRDACEHAHDYLLSTFSKEFIKEQEQELRENNGCEPEYGMYLDFKRVLTEAARSGDE
jgi:hypothetical protein